MNERFESFGSRFEGSCLCEAVRLRVTAPTKWCAHCHCSMCQRAHGSAFVTWVGVDETRFELLSDAMLRWYKSSAPARRGFCSQCGSPLLFQSSRWPGEMHIARACIPGEIDRLPEAHVFAKSQAAWLDLNEHLPWKD